MEAQKTNLRRGSEYEPPEIWNFGNDNPKKKMKIMQNLSKIYQKCTPRRNSFFELQKCCANTYEC